jgi:hypothetical protein
MNYIPTRLGAMPLLLYCLENECIVIERAQPFKHLVDMSEDYYLVFDEKGFSITGAISSGKWDEEYKYGEMIEYKKQPMLLGWLKSFNLSLNF